MGSTARSVSTLADLEPGECAVVAAVSRGCPEAERRRLLELGFFPGTEVCAVLRSPMGSPVAYEVRGMTVALRPGQARNVELEPEPGTTDE